MLDDETRRIARQLIEVEFRERDDSLRRELEIAVNQLTVQGYGRGGAVIERVGQISDEVKVRAQIALRHVLEAVSAATTQLPPDELGASIKHEVEIHLPPHLSKLRHLVSQVTQVTPDLENARQRALQQVNAKVDLMMAKLKAQPSVSAGGSTVVNINVAVGSVLTGVGASATTIQVLGTTERRAAADVLDELRTRIVGLEDRIAGLEKPEVLAVIDEARDEVQKERPNKFKLTGLLTTIAGPVKTIASLVDLYEKLRTALAGMGILVYRCDLGELCQMQRGVR